MGQRFQVGWMRLIPFIGYHHVLMIIIAISIILLSVLLAGCTTTALSNVYLLSLLYSPAGASPANSTLELNPDVSATFASLTRNITSPLEIRIGYLGFCILQTSPSLLLCSTKAQVFADLVRDLHPVSGDPLNLIWIANNFKNEVAFSGLIFTSIPLMFISFCLLGTFPGWHEEEDANGSEREVKPFPSRPVSQIALAMVGLSSILAFISIFWQHISSSTALVMSQGLSYGAIDGHVGTAAAILGWGGVFLVIVAGVGLLIMILAIRVLSETFA